MVNGLISVNEARKFLKKQLNERITDEELEKIIINLTQLVNVLLNNKEQEWKQQHQQKL